MLRRGDRVAGRFEVLGQLGDGGMAWVFLVKDINLQAVRALKILKPNLLTKGYSRQRFLREGRLLARLKHPNLVEVIDLIDSEHGGQPLVALLMKYVHGETLDAHQRQQCGPLPDLQVLDVMSPVLGATEYAHDCGLVHRDLSPDNIMVQRTVDGRLWPIVLDFGIVKLLYSATDDDEDGREVIETRLGAEMGHSRFMSPEQVENPGLVDHRSDIFTLGAVLYQLTTGFQAFDGPSSYLIQTLVRNGEFPLPSERRPDIRPALEACIMRAMQVDRERRYQSCREFHQDLADALGIKMLRDELEVPAILEPGDALPQLVDSEAEPGTGMVVGQATGGGSWLDQRGTDAVLSTDLIPLAEASEPVQHEKTTYDEQAGPSSDLLANSGASPLDYLPTPAPDDGAGAPPDEPEFQLPLPLETEEPERTPRPTRKLRPLVPLAALLLGGAIFGGGTAAAHMWWSRPPRPWLVLYRDADGDGYGALDKWRVVPGALDGFVDQAGDCDDRRDDARPGLPERCNGRDDDCDGDVDEEDAVDIPTWYADSDGDGFGDESKPLVQCAPPEGYASKGGDCDDRHKHVNPQANEIKNGTDDNCNGDIDEVYWYPDEDGDGWGDPDTSKAVEEKAEGYVLNFADCDDGNPQVCPHHAELMDQIDNDCDEWVDEIPKYRDYDQDGFGDPAEILERPKWHNTEGYVLDNTDCDDKRALSNPDATETCNGEDDDCDGVVDEDESADVVTWYRDYDNDNYGDPETTDIDCDQPRGYVPYARQQDCDDRNGSIHPGAPERCSTQGVDDDCDGVADESDAVDVPTWYLDSDRDGWPSSTSVTQCFAPSKYISRRSKYDCDDRDRLTYPGAVENREGIDSDCDETPYTCWTEYEEQWQDTSTYIELRDNGPCWTCDDPAASDAESIAKRAFDDECDDYAYGRSGRRTWNLTPRACSDPAYPYSYSYRISGTCYYKKRVQVPKRVCGER